MAEPSPIYTATDTADWQAGDFLREGTLLSLLQTIKFLTAAHNHNGDAGDGATLATADPKAIWYYALASN